MHPFIKIPVTGAGLTELKDRVQHAGPLSSRPAQHRAHWTTQHKAKQMSNSIRRVRCRNVSKHKCILRSVSDTATQQFWSLQLLKDYSSFTDEEADTKGHTAKPAVT